MYSIFTIQSQISVTIITYHLTAVRMAIINKSTNNKCWQGCGEKGTLVYHWWKCQLVQPLWKTVQRFLKKFNMELPYDQFSFFFFLLLGIYPKNSETLIWNNTCTLMFIAVLFTIAKIWMQSSFIVVFLSVFGIRKIPDS